MSLWNTSTSTIDEQVVYAKNILLTGDVVARKFILNGALTKRRDIRAALFAAFEDGFTLPTEILTEIHRQQWSSTYPREWLRADVFEDDAAFSPDRFFLTFAAKTLPAEREQAAIAQARRLLAWGSVDPVYFTSLGGSVEAFGTELMVYIPDRESKFRGLLAYTPLASASLYGAKLVDEARERLDWIAAERQRVFLADWLPNLLPAAEWAQVKDLPGQLLRELYAPIFEAGYAGYRASMLARAGA